MANGNAYKHYMASNVEAVEKKEYNIMWALFVVAIVILVLMIWGVLRMKKYIPQHIAEGLDDLWIRASLVLEGHPESENPSTLSFSGPLTDEMEETLDESIRHYDSTTLGYFFDYDPGTSKNMLTRSVKRRLVNQDMFTNVGMNLWDRAIRKMANMGKRLNLRMLCEHNDNFRYLGYHDSSGYVSIESVMKEVGVLK